VTGRSSCETDLGWLEPGTEDEELISCWGRIALLLIDGLIAWPFAGGRDEDDRRFTEAALFLRERVPPMGDGPEITGREGCEDGDFPRGGGVVDCRRADGGWEPEVGGFVACPFGGGVGAGRDFDVRDESALRLRRIRTIDLDFCTSPLANEPEPEDDGADAGTAAALSVERLRLLRETRR